MGNRSKCKSPGSFGSKVMTDSAFRVPKDQVRKGDIILHERGGIYESDVPDVLVRSIMGVVRPNRGRALWKNQSLNRKGFKPVKFSKVLKDAQKQTAASKERDASQPKKGFNLFQRKGSA